MGVRQENHPLQALIGFRQLLTFTIIWGIAFAQKATHMAPIDRIQTQFWHRNSRRTSPFQTMISFVVLPRSIGASHWSTITE